MGLLYNCGTYFMTVAVTLQSWDLLNDHCQKGHKIELITWVTPFMTVVTYDPNG